MVVTSVLLSMRKDLMNLSLYLLALSLFGCARLPHVDPEPRDHSTMRASTVRVDVRCGFFDDVLESTATGVIISERHVLTAAHAVRCTEIPTVHVTYLTPDGDERRLRMVVTHDDAVYGEWQDIARMEVASAENFGVRIAPPLISPGWPKDISYYPVEWCAYLRSGEACGEGSYREYTLQAQVRPGDSGSPVYDEKGRLVGLVVRGGPYLLTAVEPVGLRWMVGT